MLPGRSVRHRVDTVTYLGGTGVHRSQPWRHLGDTVTLPGHCRDKPCWYRVDTREKITKGNSDQKYSRCVPVGPDLTTVDHRDEPGWTVMTPCYV